MIPLLSMSAAVAVIHTLLGPDHYAPLTAFAKAHHWTRKKTAVMALLCGLGHIAGSVILGSTGVFLNFSLEKWQTINNLRHETAAWLWIAAGLLYLVWAVKDRYRRARGPADFFCEDNAGARGWIFFVIFVLGPCEPLLLLMQHPIAKGSLSAGVGVVSVFGAATILTMVLAVLALSAGLDSFRLRLREHDAHFAAASMMILCGVGIKFGGL